MKTKPVFGALMTVAFALQWCSFVAAQAPSISPSKSKDSAPNLAATAAPKPTLADFSGLPKGITLRELQRRVGQADEIIGSGVAYYVYHLADGSKVSVLCNDAVNIPFIDHFKDGVKTRLYPVQKPVSP